MCKINFNPKRNDKYIEMNKERTIQMCFISDIIFFVDLHTGHTKCSSTRLYASS